MATLTKQLISITGTTPSFGTATGGGDNFPNDGVRTFLVVKNGDASPMTVTFDDTGSVEPAGSKTFDADVEVTVGATDEEWIGPFPKSRFGASVGVTYSAVTSLTVAAIAI